MGDEWLVLFPLVISLLIALGGWRDGVEETQEKKKSARGREIGWL